VNLVVKIENPSSNLLEICIYISSFLHCRLVQKKTFFTLPLGPEKDLFLVGVDMARECRISRIHISRDFSLLSIEVNKQWAII
jgi:hypothetical protein